MNRLHRKILCALLLLLPVLFPLKNSASDSVVISKSSITEFDEVVFVTRKMPKDGHWYANFGYYAWDENNKLFEEGSSLCKLNIKTDQLEILFKDEKGTFRDPQLHYDGKNILFSYRKGGEEHFHLYETDTDGSFLKQLTSGPFSDIEPTYLPDDDIIFVSTRCECWVNCWSTQVATLHRCKSDGSEITKLSSNIEHDNTPWVLSSGQIAYTRWEYVDRSQVHFHHLWVMNPDGSRQTVLYGNQTSVFENPGSCLLIDAKPVPWSNDTILATYSPGHGAREHAGYPVLISLSNGPDDLDAMKFVNKKSDKGDKVYDPVAINRELLMASRNRDLVLINNTGIEKSIFELPKDFIGGKQIIFEPRPVVARKREPIVSSHLNTKNNYGTIILQNVYEGRNMSGIEKGSISDILVLETLRKPVNFTGGNEPLSYTGSFTMEKIIGKVPVHEDGSAHFNLPANTPFLFIALDEKGSAIQKMKSFTSVVPGEVVSCIGCHEKRSLAPTNYGRLPIAMTKDAVFPEPVINMPLVIDFPRDIQPILDRNCVKCHNPEIRKGGILLTGDRGPVYSHSYFNLMAHFQVNDGLNHPYPLNKPGMVGDKFSKIIEKIENGHGKVNLTENEIQTIRYWINTGALYPGTYAALGTGILGLMTNNNPDQTPVQNKEWEKATTVINKNCKSCHDELMKDIVSEENLTWWRSRVDVSSGNTDMKKYKEAIRFSRHIIYNLNEPEKSTILLAPLAKEAGGYGLCKTGIIKSPVFKTKSDKDYVVLLNAVTNSSEYLNSIKRFDMDGFVVRPDYFREMKKYGIIDENTLIQDVNPYKADSIYWSGGNKKYNN